MPLFRVIHNNTDHNRKTYQAREWIKADENLAAKFPDKFEVVSDEAVSDKIREDVPAGLALAAETGVEYPAKDDPTTPDDSGFTDATTNATWVAWTAKHKIIVKHSGLPLAKGGGYFLFAPDKTPINTEGLPKLKVVEAIDAYVNPTPAE